LLVNQFYIDVLILHLLSLIYYQNYIMCYC